MHSHGYSFTSRFLMSIIKTRYSISCNSTGNFQIFGSDWCSIFKVLSVEYSIRCSIGESKKYPIKYFYKVHIDRLYHTWCVDVYQGGACRHDHKDRTGVGSTGSLDFDQMQRGVSQIYCGATKPSSTAIRSLIFTAAVAMWHIKRHNMTNRRVSWIVIWLPPACLH